MASYVINTQVERTVLLLNAGSPVPGVLPAAVTVQYKKAGQASFSTLAMTSLNWLEIGGGYYTLIFAPAQMDTSGTFAYNATGGAFDNLIFDQFNVIDPSLSGEQQAYFQDVASERTVFLSLAGIPSATVLPANVLCSIKKSGQIGFSSKLLTIENWINLGGGYYNLKFSVEDMSRVGTFVYTLVGADFDNFAYDEFVILAAEDTTTKDKCIVSGQFISLSGDTAKQIRVTARTVDFPAKTGDRIVSGDEVFTYLDFQGKFELPLLRGSTVIIEVPRAAIRNQVNIPDTATANLIDLLPPFAIDYSV